MPVRPTPHRITKDDGSSDGRSPRTQLHDQIRGLHPWPHASTFSRPPAAFCSGRDSGAGTGLAAPGTVLEAEADALVIAAGHGTLRILDCGPRGGGR